MNIETDKRQSLLKQASKKSSILAIMALLGVLGAGYNLYLFITDAADNVLERYYNIGPIIIPGSGIEINQAQLSVGVAAVLVIIPLIILIMLLSKKGTMKRSHIPGTGLYWVLILAALLVILTALGIIPKLIKGETDLLNLNMALPNLAAAAVALITAVISSLTLFNIGKASSYPDYIPKPRPVDDFSEAFVVDRDDSQFQPAGAPIMDRSEPAVVHPFSDTTSDTIVLSPNAQADLSAMDHPTIAMPTADFNPYAAEQAALFESTAEALVINEVPDVERDWDEVTTSPEGATERTIDMEVLHAAPAAEAIAAEMEIETPAPDIYVEAPIPETFVEQPIPETFVERPIPEIYVEKPAVVKDRETKIIRRYIELPGEDKVIVITREFTDGALTGETSEIKDKLDLV